MKKVILTIIILSNILFSQEIVTSNNKINYSVGLGYPGLFFRQHKENGYLEYITWLELSQDNKNISFYFNKAQYLEKYVNDNLDFSLKYVYGADVTYINSAHRNNGSTFIGANIGLGIETISPQSNGVVVDIFMGERINYFFEDSNFAISPLIRLAVLFNF